jgi:hypothetical protein
MNTDTLSTSVLADIPSAGEGGIMLMEHQLNVKTALLKPLETAVLPATTAPVIIRDHFKRNSSVRIATIFAEFKNRFFDKSEGPTAEVMYRKYKLLCISADGPIIADLGGESKVEGAFTAAFSLLRRQPKGEPGFLQTNGYANIFYVRDKKRALCAVRIGWASDGWVVDAISVTDPLGWNGEHFIFCPHTGNGAF